MAPQPKPFYPRLEQAPEPLLAPQKLWQPLAQMQAKKEPATQPLLAPQKLRQPLAQMQAKEPAPQPLALQPQPFYPRPPPAAPKPVARKARRPL